MIRNPRDDRAFDVAGKAQRFCHAYPSEFWYLYGKRPERNLIICQRNAVMNALLVKARIVRPLLEEIGKRLAHIEKTALRRAFRDLCNPRERLPFDRIELFLQGEHGRRFTGLILSLPFG